MKRTHYVSGVAHNGQMAAILNLCYNTLHITYFHRYSPDGASVVGFAEVCALLNASSC